MSEKPSITLRPYQVESKRAIYAEFRQHRSTLLVLATGCLAPNTEVLLADGRARAISNVQVGDHLLGPDGSPRLVSATHQGTSQMVRITPVKGTPWECTTDHHLTLVYVVTGKLIDVPVALYLDLSRSETHGLKLARYSMPGGVPEAIGFSVEILEGLRPYAGVTVDGDHRYLLGDFTITHNCGKTVVFTAIVADGLRKGKRVLVLAHRDELIEQAVKTIERSIGCEVLVEKGDRRDVSRPASLFASGQGHVVVSSIQTMVRRIDSIAVDAFDLVIRDEAHHARSQSDEAVLAHFAKAKVLGVTATPNRGDAKALGAVFQSVAFDMNILDAISEGWLVPVRQKQIDLPGLDLASMRKVAGDFNRGQLAEVMEDLDMLRSISDPTVRYLEGRQALVFCVSIRHAELQAESIREVMRDFGVDGEVVALDGTAPDGVRKDVVSRFRASKIKVLVGCELFTEGFDAPTCSLIVMARPTQSKALYLQMLGRGTRPLPGVVDGPGTETATLRRAAIAASPKPDMLVLDLVGNTGKHEMIHAEDLLGGDGDEADIRAAERILARGDTDDLMKALELARALRLGKDREALAKAGDFFAIFGLLREHDQYGRAMTAAQKVFLAKSGIPTAGIDRRGASQAIAEIHRRRDKGLCNYKQAKVLVRARVPLLVVERAPFAAATDAISRLSAAGWKLTSDAWWRDTLARADLHVVERRKPDPGNGPAAKR